MKPVIFLAPLNPLSKRDEQSKRNKYANDQDDGKCDCVHGILLSFNYAQCIRYGDEKKLGEQIIFGWTHQPKLGLDSWV